MRCGLAPRPAAASARPPAPPKCVAAGWCWCSRPTALAACLSSSCEAAGPPGDSWCALQPCSRRLMFCSCCVEDGGAPPAGFAGFILRKRTEGAWESNARVECTSLPPAPRCPLPIEARVDRVDTRAVRNSRGARAAAQRPPRLAPGVILRRQHRIFSAARCGCRTPRRSPSAHPQHVICART
eukprot:365192-Chlamydomonas_euryale.AAC.34